MMQSSAAQQAGQDYSANLHQGVVRGHQLSLYSTNVSMRDADDEQWLCRTGLKASYADVL